MHGQRACALGWLSVSLAACSTMGAQPCLPGQQAAVQELVYFGAETPSGQVTPEEWTRFLAEIVTPRFPKGFTTWQASGQWLSEAGGIVREPSYVLSVVHQQGKGDAAMRDVVATYKTRYQQEAVLQVRSDACMGL